jgi:hypothetical protein
MISFFADGRWKTRHIASPTRSGRLAVTGGKTAQRTDTRCMGLGDGMHRGVYVLESKISDEKAGGQLTGIRPSVAVVSDLPWSVCLLFLRAQRRWLMEMWMSEPNGSRGIAISVQRDLFGPVVATSTKSKLTGAKIVLYIPCIPHRGNRANLHQ